MFQSTKTYGHNIGISCCFRQWRADSHCKYLHGYALEIKLIFEADTLDGKNWVVDFGGLTTLKDMLMRSYDHRTIIARDDPYFDHFVELNTIGVIQMRAVDAVGCEAFAEQIYDMCEHWLNNNDYTPRVALHSVEVREHGANSAVYIAD